MIKPNVFSISRINHSHTLDLCGLTQIQPSNSNPNPQSNLAIHLFVFLLQILNHWIHFCPLPMPHGSHHLFSSSTPIHHYSSKNKTPLLLSSHPHSHPPSPREQEKARRRRTPTIKPPQIRGSSSPRRVHPQALDPNSHEYKLTPLGDSTNPSMGLAT